LTTNILFIIAATNITTKMVSLENGRFILRRRQQPSAQSRLLRRLFPTAKIVVLASILLLWGYLVRRASEASVDHDMLRASRDADIIPTFTVDGERGRQQQRDDQPPPLHVLNTFEVDDKNNEGAGDGEQNYSQTGASADEQEDGESDDGDEGEPSDGDELSNSAQEGEAKQYSLKLNSTFLAHLQSLDSLPKNVHIFFPDKEYYRKQPILPFVSFSIISMINLNPDWNVTVYDDEMIDRVIQNAGNVGIISKEEVDVLIGVEGEEEGEGGHKQTAHIVERCDIARLLLMYQEGGVYLDVDRLVSRKFADFITPSTRLCLPTHFDINFAQDIMCSSRGNEMFLSIIQRASTIRMESERRKGWVKGGLLYDMGPSSYNSQILMNVFGMDSKAYDRHKGEKAFFAQARDAISASHGTIITKLESDYCNDTLVLDDSIPVCPRREELYDRYGMTPWSEEVNAIWESDRP
jgi:hypothetical protein